MGIKDITEKHLEDFAEVFSDIINDSSINGQEVLDYYIPILRMVKAMLVLVVGRITS